MSAIRPARPSDHQALVRVVDDWWGRQTRWALPRLWLDHFAGTSLIAEEAGAGGAWAPAGFLVGFVSQDHPETAYLHLVGVAPGRRRRGLGRALVEQFVAVARDRGAARATTIAWPGDPIALSFLRSAGFVVSAAPGTRPLYGTPAHTDWNREGDDQVVLDREF